MTDNLLSRWDWVVAHQPSVAELERVTRQLMDDHDEWDTPHRFVTYYQQPDGTLRGAAMMALAPDIDPSQYPAVLGGLLARHIAERYRKDPAAPALVAASLQFEGYDIGATNGELTDAQRSALRTRTLRELPEREEVCIVITTDVGGRRWWASKTRGEDGYTCQKYESADADGPAGEFVRMMRTFTDAMPDIYLGAANFVPGAFRSGQ